MKGGPRGSKGALLVSGEIAPGLAYAWAGVAFTPGDRPMAPANLSSKSQLHFAAKGDGGTYQVMLFSESRGFAPLSKVFTAGPQWKEYSFAFEDFDRVDGHDLAAIAFVGGPRPGKIQFQLDNVRLK